MMRRLLSFLVTVLTVFYAYSQTVKGTVSDSMDKIPYATVAIKGTDRGVLTDEGGAFVIAASNKDTLLISHVGLKAQEVPVSDQKVLSVFLEGERLDEVVLTAQSVKSEKTVIGGCYDVGRVFRCAAIGIKIEEQRDLEITEINMVQVYPNPSSSGLYQLVLIDSYKTLDIAVFGMDGRQVYAKRYDRPTQNFRIDLSAFPQGMYLINLIGDGRKLPTQKVLRS